VVAYAIAGSMDVDLFDDPLGQDPDGNDVFLRDIWPSPKEVEEVIAQAITAEMFSSDYSDVFGGGERWKALPTPEGDTFAWDPDSTYVRRAPYFDGMPKDPEPVTDVEGARVLLKLGDSVTTDHISPAGSIKEDSPAGKWLKENGVQKADFNSYGSRRGNHDVMMRGTFANVRIKNLMIPAKADGSRVEGGLTIHQPSGEQLSIYDAAMKYIDAGTPTIVFAGEEYGTGSSRDWAAKGTQLLGVKAVVARSFERIHRSNLVGMGVLPLQFKGSDSVQSLGITGEETYDIEGLGADFKPQQEVTLVIRGKDGKEKRVPVLLRIDTPIEVDYYKHGGILPFVLRSLLAA
jgi:aconitate hydratase